MINNFEQLVNEAKKGEKKKIAVAAAADLDVLSAVENARKNGIANAILVGDEPKLKEIAAENNIDLANYEIVHAAEKAEAASLAAKLVAEGKAQVLMKGLVDTSIFLKAVLDKEIGLRTGKLITQTTLFEVDGFDDFVYVSDPAITMDPDVAQKKDIIENAVHVAHKLGHECPMVAPICAVEKFNPKMQATVDAQELHEMNERGEITGCYVSGPVSLDVAVSKESAKHKGFTDKIGGSANILLMDDIEAGNVLYKSIIYFAKGKCAGVVSGAKCPIILTSRADSDISKFYSIATAMLISE
ncbi:bifunctional enoyl-CoA hydratase/phosphate acetyltransferase [Tyzzerella sp. OttesenSCG-928-J15]|nr:bifunctional enoyl-CoA hydratase/phosphate acetyltransferase [Tyzzerella sp. OttesenSCG-928-J15]